MTLSMHIKTDHTEQCGIKVCDCENGFIYWANVFDLAFELFKSTCNMKFCGWPNFKSTMVWRFSITLKYLYLTLGVSEFVEHYPGVMRVIFGGVKSVHCRKPQFWTVSIWFSSFLTKTRSKLTPAMSKTPAAVVVCCIQWWFIWRIEIFKYINTYKYIDIRCVTNPFEEDISTVRC